MSLKLHGLKPAHGANRKRRRIGRGPGSGRGKTAGRGAKGQKSRSGFSQRAGFEGGQMPLYRRVPKRGFRNLFSKEFVVLNVGDLNRFENGVTVSPELLVKQGIVRKMKDGLRILGDGELKKKLTVRAHHFSKLASEKIQKVGGTTEVIS